MCTESCIGQEKNQKFTEINILKGRLRKKKKKKLQQNHQCLFSKSGVSNQLPQQSSFQKDS